MNAVPAFRHLTEFGATTAVQGQSDTGASRNREGADAAASVDAGIAEAYARGVESGKAAVRTECDAKLAEERTQIQSRLSAERNAWAAQEGAELAKLLTSGLAELQGRVAESAARILAPFLAEELKRRAVADLLHGIETILSSGTDGVLSISGPEDLLRAIRDGVAGRQSAVAYVPRQTCDVRVTLDQTVIEAGLESWIAGIKEAVR
ncbi:MAG: hypothetical protein F9K29_09490 [Hyphomicrobiaceae bacterium]|nr:MAG: hypothetical protein F9K29_09490 [Hyphomicrobiaceae bacterium]